MCSPPCVLPCRFTLPCPSNPYRTRRDEQAMYVVPTFWLRLKAHMEDQPLYGLH